MQNLRSYGNPGGFFCGFLSLFISNELQSIELQIESFNKILPRYIYYYLQLLMYKQPQQQGYGGCISLANSI